MRKRNHENGGCYEIDNTRLLLHKGDKMNIRSTPIRLQCATLILILLLMSLSSCFNRGTEPATDAVSNETEAPATDAPLPSYRFEELRYADTVTKPKIRAAFEKTDQIAESMIPIVINGENDGPKVTVSSQWNCAGVTLYVTFDQAEQIKVTVGTFTDTYTAGLGETVTVRITVEEMKIAIVDVGQEIPLVLDVYHGANSKRFDGCILLSDYSVFQSFDGEQYSQAFKKAVQSVYGTTTIANQSDSGAKVKNGSYLIYDKYSSVGKNYAHLRNVMQSVAVSNLGISVKEILVDFDLTIHEMPLCPWTYLNESNAYGLSIVLTGAKDDGTAMIGFVNTSDGIYAFLNGTSSGTSALIATGKSVGDSFHIGLIRKNNNVDILIDNIVVGSFENATVNRAADLGSNTLSFIWQRTDVAPASSDDNFSASIDNISMANISGSSILNGITADDLLTSEAKTVDADRGIFLADRNLTLPTVTESRKYGLTASLVWYSTNTEVIGVDGGLKNPENVSEFVSVQAYLVCDNVIVSEKAFPFFVKARIPATNVMWVKYDVDPITGVGTTADAPYVADDAFNSIVYDMGKISSVNRIQLNSLNGGTRITKNFVALYASDDNVTYRAIPSFTMLQNENQLYFYNFSVEARYLKVHFTYETSPAEHLSIFNSLQKQMVAYYSDTPLLSGDSAYAKRTTLTVQNTAAQTLYNKIESYTLEELGISKADLKADMSDIRFQCNGMELPHYISGGIIYLRILEIPVGESAEITVLYGNASAQSVSNGVETFEVEYGSKVTTIEPNGVYWITSVEQMPDGSLITVGNYKGQEHLGIRRSYDGGRTWEQRETIVYTTSDYNQAIHKVDDSGGFIVDRETGTVYFFCFRTVDTSDKRPILLVSRDSGKTWERKLLTDLPKSSYVSYSDGIKLSCADGNGANVDYVFALTMVASTNGVSAAVTSALYSKDGGATWQLSESRIDFENGNYDKKLTYENGIQEETILEMSDGTLLLMARCQVPNVLHFAVSRSYDHGVTWQENVELSNVYAPNTQPILIANEDTPILMWGGNNALGAHSYTRFPMNLAYSMDNGLTFTGILDASFQTSITSRTKNHYSIVNPDIVIFERGGVKCAYILSTNYRILIENFDDYLYKTTGAFDSFENGSMETEGWVSVVDSDSEGSVAPNLVKTGATDGDYALHIGSHNKLSRSIPQVSRGSAFLDLYVEKLGGMVIELQTAYHHSPNVCAPISLLIGEDGKISYVDHEGNKRDTGLTVGTGSNRITIDFNGAEDTASLTVNGKTASIAFRTDIGDSVCFAYVYTQNHTSVCLDRFIVIDMD